MSKTFKKLYEKAMVNHGVKTNSVKNGNPITGNWTNDNEDNTVQDVTRALVLVLNNDGFKIKKRVEVLDKKGKELNGDTQAPSSGTFKAS